MDLCDFLDIFGITCPADQGEYTVCDASIADCPEVCVPEFGTFLPFLAAAAAVILLKKLHSRK